MKAVSARCEGRFTQRENSRNEILDELVGRDHRLAVERVDSGVEAVLQGRVPLERCLEGRDATLRIVLGHYRKRNKRTHVLVQELVQYPNELVENEGSTLEGRLLNALDLLLDNDLEGSRTDEKGGGRSLQEAQVSSRTLERERRGHTEEL